MIRRGDLSAWNNIRATKSIELLDLINRRASGPSDGPAYSMLLRIVSYFLIPDS